MEHGDIITFREDLQKAIINAISNTNSNSKINDPCKFQIPYKNDNSIKETDNEE